MAAQARSQRRDKQQHRATQHTNNTKNNSAIPLPPTDYNLFDALPSELVTSGKLSQLQLEGILYACARHQEILPSGERAGFFIGDGAGVGKGRQIAGCILDGAARGRRRAV